MSHASFVEPNVFISGSITAPTSARIHPMCTRSLNNIVQQRQLTDGTIRYPIPRALLAETHSALMELNCFFNAIPILEWRAAMQLEFNALFQNKTWSLVPPQTATNIVGYK
jgi:hypothetical protein